MRLDILLVKKGFFESREKATYAIKNGGVKVKGKFENKPSREVDENTEVSIEIHNSLKYVSLGGLKLEKAIQEFQLNFIQKKILDVGASTGGFTDCALQNGADLVWAVDVGTGQLHQSLRNNERVRFTENIHIKDLSLEMLDNYLFDFIVVDLSFISLRQVFCYLPKFLNTDGKVLALIKPQFEAGKESLGKNGIVKNQKVHIKVWNDILESSKINGLYLTNVCCSPIREKNKNIEYLGLFSRHLTKMPDVQKIVHQAFDSLKQLVVSQR